MAGRQVAPDVAPRIPSWLPAALFLGLTALLFRRFVFSDQMLFGGDTLGLGYVARAFYADALADGTFPRWAPLILGGTPFLEALSGGDSLYPPSLLLLLLLEPYRALGWKLVVHYAAAGFFLFGWTRALGASRAGALLAGTAYLLAPYFVSLVHPGHDGKIFVTALAPLRFWAVERHFVRASLGTFAGIALVVGLVISTTHFQMAYFLFGAVGLYAIFRAVTMWRGAGTGAGRRAAGRRFGVFLSASLAGAALAAGQLLPAVDYVTEYSRRIQTTREAAQESGVAWSSSWSLHPEEAMALVIPEFAGNAAGGADWAEGTYWGRNVTRDNHPSSGLVVLLLAAVAVVAGRRRPREWFFVGLAGLTLLFALGAHTPVWRLFYEAVPGIRLFRAPDQVMFLFVLPAATLAAFGLDRILRLGEDAPEERLAVLRTLWAACALMGLLALLASTGALTSLWTSIVYTDADAARLDRLARLEPFIARGAGIGLVLALATAGVAWARARGHFAPAGAAAALVVLVAADELRVSSVFVQVMDFEEWAAPDGFHQAILQREEASDDPYRLLSFRRAGQDVMPTLYGIELAAGHHPNDLSRYRELIGMVGSGLPQNLLDDDIRRLLNVRYVLWPEYQAGGALSPPEQVVAQSRLQSGEAYETLYTDPGLPRARLVGAATVQPDDQAVGYMLSAAFDPEREVVLPEPPPIELDGEPAEGSVEWLERTPNLLRLSVSTERPALLVVADNWFPAWETTVDGEEVPLLRAYHSLRAVPVPAGTHTVEMRYHSEIVGLGLWLSLAMLVGLAGLLAFHLWRERRSPGRP
ncbi:MAG TPA: hypothetical protein VMM35_01195 [Longimicrobiales bacterium]|nr:hypothetical protein [Longimicrobiales bacterium]